MCVCAVLIADEIDSEGKILPTSNDSGALYWTSAAEPTLVLTFRRCIPLRNIRELLLGRESQVFKSPACLACNPAVCFTIRCDEMQLDLECVDEVQAVSWLLGIVNMMLQDNNRKLIASDDSPLATTPRNSETAPNDAPASTLAPPQALLTNGRRSTRRFSVMPAQPHEVDQAHRRVSVAWFNAAQGDAVALEAVQRHRATLKPPRQNILHFAATACKACLYALPREPACCNSLFFSTGLCDTERPPSITFKKSQLDYNVVRPFHVSLSSIHSTPLAASHMRCIAADLSDLSVRSRCAGRQNLKDSFEHFKSDMQSTIHGLSSYMTDSILRLSAVTAAQQQHIATLNTQHAHTTAEHASTITRIQSELYNEQRKRKTLQNKVIDLQGNIRVYCRVRPINEREKSDGDEAVVDCSTETTLTIADKAAATTKAYEFDRVFDPQSSQEDVYRDVAPFVQSAVDGYSVCVFAYGQTGSGKSYTMEGSAQDKGVNYRALTDLFALTRVDEHRSSPFSPYHAAAAGGASPTATDAVPPNLFLYLISVSIVEIYNEQIVDLLVKRRDQRPLDIKQSPNSEGGVYIPDLTETTVSSVADVHRLLQDTAYPNRHVSATGMNEHSSRSHCLLFVRVVGTNWVTEEKTFGRLVLIDLAGSERLTRSGVSGQGVKEAQCINQSLSALGNCLNALQSKAAHIPYRNSKLTYLLSDCLGGSSKCLMFCQLSPAGSSYGESVCSLGFAVRARSVELGVATKRNAGGDEVKKVKGQVKEERKEKEKWINETTKAKQTLVAKESEVAEKAEAVARLMRELKEKEREVAVMKEREAEREKELVALRDAMKKKDKKRVEWPDTKRLQSPTINERERDQENVNVTPALSASMAALLKPTISVQVSSVVMSPLKELNKKRKDSPIEEDNSVVPVKRKVGTAEPAVMEMSSTGSAITPTTAANPASTAASTAAPQAHSRIGAALREKYRKAATPSTTTASSTTTATTSSPVSHAASERKPFVSSRMADLAVSQQVLGSAASSLRSEMVAVKRAAAAASVVESRKVKVSRPLLTTPSTTRYVSRSEREWRA